MHGKCYQTHSGKEKKTLNTFCHVHCPQLPCQYPLCKLFPSFPLLTHNKWGEETEKKKKEQARHVTAPTFLLWEDVPHIEALRFLNTVSFTVEV